MPEIFKHPSPSGKFLRDDGTWNAVGAGSFSGTMDDIPDGSTYVKTENNYTDADKTIVDGVTAALAGKAPSLGADDNYVTDAEKTKLANLSGTNSGDQDLSGLVVKNIAITGATKTKVTYDTKGLITSGADATTADITDSADKRYCTDAQKTVIGNTSGTNTGDNAVNSNYSGLAASKADLASPTFTGTPLAPAPAAGTNTTQISTTAYAMAAAPNASYRTLLDSSGSHTAAKVAGTYGMGQGTVLAVSGTGTLYPLNTIYIAAADYPTVNGLAPKLRIRATVYCNDVAPTGNFTVGLHPITRPATSGGAGLVIYTIGAAVTGSNGASVATPAADSSNSLVGSDFALPADGHYIIAVVTTATIATSAHVHISASLQLRNA